MVSLWNSRIFKIRDVEDFSEEDQHKRRICHLIYSQAQRDTYGIWLPSEETKLVSFRREPIWWDWYSNSILKYFFCYQNFSVFCDLFLFAIAGRTLNETGFKTFERMFNNLKLVCRIPIQFLHYCFKHSIEMNENSK